MWHVLVNGDMGSFGGRPGVMRLATLSSRLTAAVSGACNGYKYFIFREHRGGLIAWLGAPTTL